MTRHLRRHRSSPGCIVAAFNAAGAGFPDTDHDPRRSRTFDHRRDRRHRHHDGLGVHTRSPGVARIPPVAAMRPELGFDGHAHPTTRDRRGRHARSARSMFLVGLFVRPGGTNGLVALAGGRSDSSCSSESRACRRRSPHRSPGRSAGRSRSSSRCRAPSPAQNVARAPRRTSSSAAALMIGVALVSAAAVFASSLRATFVDTLENAVTADYIVTDEGFQGLSPVVAETLAAVPELEAVTPVRGIGAQVDGRPRRRRCHRRRRLREARQPRPPVRFDRRAATRPDAGARDPASDLDLAGRRSRSTSRTRTASPVSSPSPASTATPRSATG